jgi:hypothetical protein
LPKGVEVERNGTEAVQVGYLYGGTAALVMGVNAFPHS